MGGGVVERLEVSNRSKGTEPSKPKQRNQSKETEAG